MGASRHKDKTFGFDFDDFLVKFAPAWDKYHTDLYGIKGSLYWTNDEELDRGHTFIHSPHHEEIEAVEGAVELVRRLHEIRNLVIVTARDKSMEIPTVKLMRKHFPNVFKGVHFLHHERKNVLGTKGDVCKRHNIHEFGDDNVHHLITTRDAGVRSFLLDRDHNKDHETPPGITRICSLSELLHIL